MTTPQLRLLTIWFGANDAVLPEFVQHVPLDEFAANLRTLIQMVRAPGLAVVCAPHEDRAHHAAAGEHPTMVDEARRGARNAE